jgi:carbamoyl-phosphate synthase large subunit
VVLNRIRRQVKAMAKDLGVIGLMNTQFAIQGEDIYMLDVNPRASRTVPYVSKATGRPLAKIAARCMVGCSLHEQGIQGEVTPDFYAVKESVFPFIKFPGVDPLLGPEMKSTGEVMGLGRTFGEAFAKSQLAAGNALPEQGQAFISVRDADKTAIVDIAEILARSSFALIATRGTAKVLQAHGIACDIVNKVSEGRPHIVDMIKNDEIDLIINTVEGSQAIADSFWLRREALLHKISYTTTIAGARATSQALSARDQKHIHKLQDLHRELWHD